MGVDNKARLGMSLVDLGMNALFGGGLDIALVAQGVDLDLDDIVGGQSLIGLFSSTRQLTLPHVLAMSPFSTRRRPAAITSFFACKISMKTVLSR